MIRAVCVLMALYNIVFAFPAITLPVAHLMRTGKNVPLWLFFLPLFIIVLVHSVRLILFMESARRAQVLLSATAFVFRLMNALFLLPALLAKADLAPRLPFLIIMLLFGLLLDSATFLVSRSRRVVGVFG